MSHLCIYVALISPHVSSAVSISPSFVCFHLLSSCVLKHSLHVSSFSLSMSNLLFSTSPCISLNFILIPANTSLSSDATSADPQVLVIQGIPVTDITEYTM